MLDPLVSAIDSLLVFADKHAGELLGPSTLLTQDQVEELTTLDTKFYAHCQLSGLSLSVIESKDDEFLCFGNSRLPYVLCKIHLPIKDDAGNVAKEMVASGMMILAIPEWRHAMRSLLATAVLKAKAEGGSKTAGASTTSAAAKDQGARLGTSSAKGEGDQGAGGESEKCKRGRPPGGTTKARDRKLYLDWKAAKRETGITKAEFLLARSLPLSDLAAIERGRKQRDERIGLEQIVGKDSVKP